MNPSQPRSDIDEFWIYKNWQAGPHKAVIHRGSCGFCNHGAGRAGGYDPKHAEWHGSFPNLTEARATSAGLRGVVARSVCRCVQTDFK